MKPRVMDNTSVGDNGGFTLLKAINSDKFCATFWTPGSPPKLWLMPTM
jgi:hypothetical protein